MNRIVKEFVNSKTVEVTDFDGVIDALRSHGEVVDEAKLVLLWLELDKPSPFGGAEPSVIDTIREGVVEVLANDILMFSLDNMEV